MLNWLWNSKLQVVEAQAAQRSVTMPTSLAPRRVRFGGRALTLHYLQQTAISPSFMSSLVALTTRGARSLPNLPLGTISSTQWWRWLMQEQRHTWSFELLVKFANNNNYVIYQTPIVPGILGLRLQYDKKYQALTKAFNKKNASQMLFGFTTGRCGFKRHQKRTFLAGEITVRTAMWFAKRAHHLATSMKLRFQGPSRYIRRYMFHLKRLSLGNLRIKVHSLRNVVPTPYNGTRLKARGRKRYRYHWHTYRRFKRVVTTYLRSSSRAVAQGRAIRKVAPRQMRPLPITQLGKRYMRRKAVLRTVAHRLFRTRQNLLAPVKAKAKPGRKPLSKVRAKDVAVVKAFASSTKKQHGSKDSRQPRDRKQPVSKAEKVGSAVAGRGKRNDRVRKSEPHANQKRGTANVVSSQQPKPFSQKSKGKVAAKSSVVAGSAMKGQGSDHSYYVHGLKRVKPEKTGSTRDNVDARGQKYTIPVIYKERIKSVTQAIVKNEKFKKESVGAVLQGFAPLLAKKSVKKK